MLIFQQGEQSKPDPKLLDELSVKVKANVTEKTMKYVSELWDSLAYRVKLPVTALLFQKVAKGCVQITWLLPFHLTHFARRRLQESTNYFQEQKKVTTTYIYRTSILVSQKECPWMEHLQSLLKGGVGAL